MEKQKPHVNSKQGLIPSIKKFVYVLNSEGEALYLSSEAKAILGKDNSEIIGLKLKEEIFEELLIREDLANERHKFLTLKEAYIKGSDPKVKAAVFEKPISFKQKDEQIIGIIGLCVVSELKDEQQLFGVAEILTQARVDFSLGKQIVEAEVSEKIAENVTVLFEQNLQFLNLKGDQWFEKGRATYLKQAQFFIERDLQMQFVIPAFPFKSPNSEHKVLGKLPDKGEELALLTLVTFIKNIGKVYDKGAKLSLVSDGRVFCDIFGVEDSIVSEYNKLLKQIMPDISGFVDFYGLEDLLQDCEDFTTARDKLECYYAKNEEAIAEFVRADENAAKIYRGFIRFFLEEVYDFMEEDKDLLRAKHNLSVKKMKKNASMISKKTMIRNEAYSSMVQDLFPHHIRLSIHAHNNSGPKFAVRLLPTDQVSLSLVSDQHLHIPTPWHNVVIEDLNQKYFLVKRFRVNRKSEYFELVYFEDGRPSHFRQVKELPSTEQL